ncbi:MAG: hypothetical protein HYU63_07080, partial [Armatimonadetes bacterium]|nr:hypothetical protein [Armatimonadota bacterium]
KKKKIKEFIIGINNKFSPLIKNIKLEYFKKLNLNLNFEEWLKNKKNEEEFTGEIFPIDINNLFYYKFHNKKKIFEAGYISQGEFKEFDNFIKKIEQTLKELDIKFTAWIPLGSFLEIKETLKKYAVKITPTEEEFKASRELQIKNAYELLSIIQKGENINLAKLFDSHLEASIIEQLLIKFEKLNLIIKDYVLFCKKSGQQILRVSTKSAIEEASEKAFKCFICGNSIAVENVGEIISCSEFGKKMLSGDYWLITRILDSLRHLGIKSEDIYFYTYENLHSFLINLNQKIISLVFTNQKLTLEEVYLINAQINTYSINHLIVIYPENIFPLIKNYLENNNPEVSFYFIENLKELEHKMEESYIFIEKNHIKEIIEPFNSLTLIDIQELILNKIYSQGKVLEDTPKGKKEKKESLKN